MAVYECVLISSLIHHTDELFMCKAVKLRDWLVVVGWLIV